MKHIVIVGAGGNIGSHLVPHVARMPEVGRVTLIDPDTYEPTNVTSQHITCRDVGRAKVLVQCRHVKRIAPSLEVRSWRVAVEDVPVGQLLSDLIVACLDSRAARQVVNEIAWRLGVPWIDAGVAPAQGLARVNVYVPALDAACLECAWDDRDYAALEQRFPCGRAMGGQPTNAPASLGALAASLQALACRRLLSGDASAAGCQVLVDVATPRLLTTRSRRLPACRLTPHRPLQITRLAIDPRVLTLRQLFDRAAADGLRPNAVALGLHGRRLVRCGVCRACGRTQELWRFVGMARSGWRCASCQESLLVTGFDLQDWLPRDTVQPTLLRRSLHRLGVRDGELCTVQCTDDQRHYIVGGDAR